MGQIHQHEENKVIRHEQPAAHLVAEHRERGPVKEHNKIKKSVKKIWGWLGKFTWLEIIGLAAAAILILDQFFAVSLSVTRKPLLQKMLGQKMGGLPPRLFSGTGAAPVPVQPAAPQAVAADPALIAQVMPPDGVTLPVVWNDLGKRLVAAGVIDQQKFEALYAQAGGMPADQKALLLNSRTGKLMITPQNANIVLNLLWALGLGNKNEILSEDMNDPKYGGDAGKFASTGGWTLAQGNAMQHFGMHSFITLTATQQAIVDRVSKNIYRPCCGNSTHFPDCNHGMAMLALLELMAAQGVKEQDMYKYALAVNSYWFPDNYVTIAAYFKRLGTDWSGVNPQTVLAAQYSSGQGYSQLLQKVAPQQVPQSQGGCGV